MSPGVPYSRSRSWLDKEASTRACYEKTDHIFWCGGGNLVAVVGGWLNMDCETGDGARIAAYTAGLVIFGFATAVNYTVIGDNI